MSSPNLTDKSEMAKAVAKEVKAHGKVDIDDLISRIGAPGHNHNGVAESVAFLLKQTGKYEISQEGGRWKIIKKERKSWQQKYWWAIAIITAAGGWFAPAIQKSIERKILPETSQSKPATPALSDSASNHKIDSPYRD